MNRRQLLRSAFQAAGLVAGAALLQACGGGGTPPAPSAAGGSSSASGSSAATSAAASSASSSAPAKAAPIKAQAGTLRAAVISDPPSLDPQWTTASVTQDYAWHVFETLLALDKDYKPVPYLAEKMDVSSDGLAYTFVLRKGVKFHDGSEMKSADVVASLARWSKLSPYGRGAWVDVDSMSAKDDYTVEIKLKNLHYSLPAALAFPSQAAAIIPKAIVEEAGTDKQITKYIGTGPYKFTERKPDQYIRLDAFDGYQPRSDPPSGLAGKREAKIKTILLIPQGDDAARVAGLEAGDYDFCDAVPPDQYDRLKGNASLTLAIVKPLLYWYGGIFNTEKGIGSNVKLRQACAAATNCEEIMTASGGPKELWTLNPSLMPPDSPWYTEGGKEYYNQKNPAKAKQLLQEAGYKGETITFMSTKDYQWAYKNSVVWKQQLEAVGMKIDLQIVPWPQLVSKRSKPEGWDVFFTGFGPVPDPSMNVFLQGCAAHWPGFYCSKPMDELAAQFQKTADFNARKEVWNKMQIQFYQDMPIVPFGLAYGLKAFTNKLKGYANFLDYFFWNATLG